jgi:uncharacterized phiE125 gp8 family phage protein
MSRVRKLYDVAPLAAAVVDLASLKAACRVDGFTDDDALITAFGISAASWIEKATGKLLSERTITMRLEQTPCGRAPLRLPGGRVASVTSVEVNGAVVTGYEVIGGAPAHLVPAQDWPSAIGDGYPVEIVYVAGYDTLPADLAHAVKMLTVDLYDHRSSGASEASHAAPMTVMALIEPHRILPW